MSAVPNKTISIDWRNEAGPIRKFLNDISITEIMINRFDRLFIERKGIIEEVEGKFDSAEHLNRFVQAIAVNVGKELNRRSPFLDARLPDGSRINIVVPPIALDSPMVTIRKFSPSMISYQNLIHHGAFDEKILYFINQAVIARQNIVISGGTGSGKTTMLNLLSQFIPIKERVITIEDTAELQLSVKNVVRMESRSSVSGENNFDIKDLLKNALRMRPDRIIIGEVRGAEAWDMLMAMNTGHEGSMGTLHANTAADAMRRIEAMVLRGANDIPISSIRKDISSTINLIIQVERSSDGSRRVSEIVEVVGRNGEEYLLEKIFEYQDGIGFRSVGYVPKFVEKGFQLSQNSGGKSHSAIANIKFSNGFFDPEHKIKLT